VKGIKIKIEDIITKNSFDMTKLLVKIVALTKNLSLSETELHALTYFVINGYNKLSRESLINNKLLKTKQQMSNIATGFRKVGIIVKNAYGEELNSDFNIDVKDIDIVKLELLIKK